MDLLLRLLITVVATLGFIVAYYIGHKKRRSEALVCPLNANCEAVIHSDYSTFLGIHLEYWGMGYYALVVLSYLSFISWPQFNFASLPQAIEWLSIIAFLFSLYLTYIQAFKLREWCTWCLISALFSSIIFLSSLALYQ
ncbi:MAG: vitamin K epoxide reductase family protein [Patescibacteria group bacterium]